MASAKVHMQLTITAEICGSRWSEAAFRAVLAELDRYPEHCVVDALIRCSREVHGQLTLAAIIQRIDDGRPTAEEAWAEVGSADESRTFVTTDETMEAWAEVRELLASDAVAARMAFKDSYGRIVARGRLDGRAPKWQPSLGTDPQQRERALREAVEKNRLPGDYVARIVGPALPPVSSAKQLPGRRQDMNALGRQEVGKVLQLIGRTSNRPSPNKSVDWEAESRRLQKMAEEGAFAGASQRRG